MSNKISYFTCQGTRKKKNKWIPKLAEKQNEKGAEINKLNLN